MATVGAPRPADGDHADARAGCADCARLRDDRGVRPLRLNEWQAGWSALAPGDQARRQARQGVAMIQADSVRVVDEAMNDVPRDGRTMGEIVMRGNNVMLGYFDDEDATAKAFQGGWLHSGDLGVQHSDGYVEPATEPRTSLSRAGKTFPRWRSSTRSRSHPAVQEVAVIGVPDEKWGERPKAFVICAGRRGERGGADRLPADAPCALQDAQGDRVRRAPSAYGDRKNTEIRAT